MESTDDAKSQLVKASKSSGRRKQLYILYLLNDLLHHTKYHVESPSLCSILAEHLQTQMNDLFGSASAHDIGRYAKHHKRIQDLLGIWDGHGYYQYSVIEKLRDTARSAARLGYPCADEESTPANVLDEGGLSEDRKDAPYIMPSSHGDPSTPFYDLPAANMLPHIMPNSATPISPQLVKPLQLVAGPADESLITAVKEFLRDIDTLDKVKCEDENQAMDVDELGQTVMRDEITGDILEGDGYYGWSRTFCEKMKRKGAKSGGILEAFGRDGSVKRNRSPRKRRHSDASSSLSSRSGSRSRGRSNSVRSRRHQNTHNIQSPTTRSMSRSRSPPREPKLYRSLRRPSNSRLRSCSYSPPPVIPAEQQPPKTFDPRPRPRDRAQGPSPPQPPPLTPGFPQGFPPLGPGGLPVPPPPPPNYKGPWPPPPPSMYDTHSTDDPPAIPPSFPHTGPSPFRNNTLLTFPRGPHNSFQGPVPENPNSWGPMHQLSDPGGRLSYNGRGRGQAHVRGNASGVAGRGFGVRGWAR